MIKILRSGCRSIASFAKKYRYLLMAVVIAAIVLPEISVYFHKPGRGSDILGYLRAGHDALQLNDLYRNSAPGIDNTWPPFFSFFIAPLAISQNLFGLPVTKIIWYFVNFTALILSMQIVSYFLYGRRPAFFKKSDFDFTSDKVFVPAFLVLPALINNFFMLQINAFILFLVLAGLLFHKKEKPLCAGVMFALAASIKAYPGLFLFYLILKKQWKTAIYTIIFGILFTLSPIIFYGIDGYINLMKEWLTISFSEPFIVGYTTFNNHSLYAFWERLLAHQLHLTEPASQMIKLFNVSSILIILIPSFALIIRIRSQKNTAILTIIEYSVICTMMILFPPIAWRHYWIIMLPAAASIYYCFRMIPKSITPVIMILSIISLSLMQIPYFSTKSSVGIFLKVNSCYTFCALSALIVLLLLYYRISKINKSMDDRSDNLQTIT